MLIDSRSQQCFFFAVLFFLTLSGQAFSAQTSSVSGTFFSVDSGAVNLIYYLNLTKPPQIKRVVFAPGNKPQTLVTDGGPFDLSSNGKMLVYSYNDRLWLLRTDRVSEPLITRGEGTRPKWSPDGELVGFVGKISKNIEAIMMMDKLGEESETLLKIDKVVNFFWSKNSDSILAAVKRKEHYFLIRIFPNGTKDLIYQFPKKVIIEESAMSPDGTKFAYISRSKNGSETIFMIDLNIYRLFRLTRPYMNCAGLSWSNDSKTLIYSGDNTLYTSRGSKGNVFQIQKNVKYPSWSKNSNQIVYVKASNSSNIAVYSVAGDYIQELDLGKAPKGNVVLIEKQVTLTDIKTVKTKGNVSYSIRGEMERYQVTAGMLLPMNSAIRSDAFGTAFFSVGEEIKVTLSPQTEMKINVNQDEGYFEDIPTQRDLTMRVLEGQVIVIDKGQKMVVNAGEEYILSLTKEANERTADKSSGGIPASLLIKRIEENTEKKPIARKKDTSMSVDHPHGADVWGHDCSECHPSQPDWRKVDYKTVEFTEEIAATCINCHRPGQSFDEKPDYNKHNFLDDPERCLDCHREKPIPGVDTYRTVTFTDGIITLCSVCHGDDDIGSSHPVGMVPMIKKYISNVKTPDTIRVMELPPDLHLDENGLMTCVTCHTVHGPWRSFEKAYAKEKPLGEIFGQEFYRTFYLRRNNFNSGLCQACHGQAGY